LRHRLALRAPPSLNTKTEFIPEACDFPIYITRRILVPVVWIQKIQKIHSTAQIPKKQESVYHPIG
jgi:hypothetical protein